MPGPKPPDVPVTDAERAQLLALVRTKKTEQRLALRARIILVLSDGETAPEAARRLSTTRRTVRLWRRYWLERTARSVADRLADAERSGTPPRITPEQWCRIAAPAHTAWR